MTSVTLLPLVEKPPVTVRLPDPRAVADEPSAPEAFKSRRPALTKVPPVWVLRPVRLVEEEPCPVPRPSVPLMTRVSGPTPLSTKRAETLTSRSTISLPVL